VISDFGIWNSDLLTNSEITNPKSEIIRVMKFIAKTLYGLEQVLAKELETLGAGDIVIANRAVLFTGNLKLMYAVNYMSRTALSVLWEIAEFSVRSAEDLYNKAQKIWWEDYIDGYGKFSIVPVVKSPIFKHTGFAGLKLKDSIADYFRKKSGFRPSVDTEDPDLVINLHISNERVTISLDSSAVPLFKRGYRKEASAAPLNEVLAAGMILLSGWEPSRYLIDPMCGSGTIPIEAAMIACSVPPGKFREKFGFEKWKNFERSEFEKIKALYDGSITDGEGARIYGSDISEEAIDMAGVNVKAAGLDNVIHLEAGDFKDIKPAYNGGVIFINPPYGERISPGETDAIYSMIGSTMKHNFEGFTAWLISSNRESVKFIGLKPSKKYTLYNGALECLFAKYELYGGSRKGKIAETLLK
jgi:putative N6-adenine-specific DNA methylase